MAFPRGLPTIPGLLTGKPTDVQVFIERIPMSEVPSDPERSSDFCVDAYARMEAKLVEQSNTGTFKGVTIAKPPR